jgi:hypothetical protein
MHIESDDTGKVIVKLNKVAKSVRIKNLIIPVEFSRLPSTRVYYRLPGKNGIEFDVSGGSVSVPEYCKKIQSHINKYDKDFSIHHSKGKIRICNNKIFHLDLGKIRPLLGFTVKEMMDYKSYLSRDISETIYKTFSIFLNREQVIYFDNLYSIPKTQTFNLVSYNDTDWINIIPSSRLELQLGYGCDELVSIDKIGSPWTCEIEYSSYLE